MKNINKIILLCVLSLMMVPTIAFASWWNPFSWNIFHKADTKTEILEKKIQELESKLHSNATSTPKEIVTATTTIITPVVKKEVKKIAPVIDNSAIIQAQAKAQIEAQLKAKAEQDALIVKQKAEAEAQALQAQRIELERQAQIEATKIREAMQKAEKEKSDALDAVNLKIANLNAKYSQDMKDCNSGGGTVSGAIACKNATTDRYTDDYNALMAEWQLIKYSN